MREGHGINVNEKQHAEPNEISAAAGQHRREISGWASRVALKVACEAEAAGVEKTIPREISRHSEKELARKVDSSNFALPASQWADDGPREAGF